MKMVLHVLFIALTSTSVFGQVQGIYVEFWNSVGFQWQAVSGHPDRLTNQPGYASGSDVTIVNANSVIYRVFAVSPTTTDIGVITVSGTGTSPQLMVGRMNATPPVLSSISRLDDYGCSDLVAIRRGGTATLTVQARVETLSGTGSPGGTLTDVDRVVRMDIDELAGSADINGSANTSLTNAGGVWVLGSMASGSAIECFLGDFDSVATLGDCEGTFWTRHGSILSFEVGDNSNQSNMTGIVRADAPPGTLGNIERLIAYGNIGSPTSNATVRASRFLMRMEALAVWADVRVQIPDGGYGNIWRMVTGDGGLSGSVAANRLNTPWIGPRDILIAGDWSSSVSLAADIRTDIVIEGDLDESSVWDVTLGLLTEATSTGQDPKVGAMTIDGSYFGSMSFGTSLQGPIVVHGDMGTTGVLMVGENIETTGSPTQHRGSLTIDEQLKGMVFIGEDLDGPIWAKNLGSSGAATALSGQIVINGRDNVSEWLDNVKLGNDSGTPAVVIGPNEAQPYQAPYYEALSSTLGGGAIGLVPFMFHADESVPAHNSVVTTGGFTGNVTIEHYGPVADGDGNTSSTPPVKVYELPLLVPCCDPAANPGTTSICDEDGNEDLYWTDVTSSYTYSVSGRVVTVSGTFSNWKAYQFIPVDLVCDIDGEPAITYAQGWDGSIGCGGTESYGYGFQLKSGLGLFDLNDDEAIDEADIDAWLASPVDFNGDGNACLIDLALLIGAVAESAAE